MLPYSVHTIDNYWVNRDVGHCGYIAGSVSCAVNTRRATVREHPSSTDQGHICLNHFCNVSSFAAQPFFVSSAFRRSSKEGCEFRNATASFLAMLVSRTPPRVAKAMAPIIQRLAVSPILMMLTYWHSTAVALARPDCDTCCCFYCCLCLNQMTRAARDSTCSTHRIH